MTSIHGGYNWRCDPKISDDERVVLSKLTDAFYQLQAAQTNSIQASQLLQGARCTRATELSDKIAGVVDIADRLLRVLIDDAQRKEDDDGSGN